MKLLLVPSIILVLSRGVGVAFAADGDRRRGRVQPKRDVTVSMSSTQTEFAADESVAIDIILKNNEANKPARILNWLNPCHVEGAPIDMSFFDVKTVGGQQATYQGALIKRKAPTNKDYTTLKAGEQISCTVNLDDYFEFTASSSDDVYEVSYTVESMQISNAYDVQGNAAMESLETNTPLTIQVDARTPPSRALRDQNLRGLQTGATTFNACSTTRQSLIREARKQALTQATSVVNLLTNVAKWGTAARCYRYDEWFGTYSSTRHNELKAGYEALRNRLNVSSVVFDCACTKPIFAYVYPASPSKIYLCNAFWNAGMSGTDSKLGTLIHEFSHFTATATTSDHAYGQSACRTLANDNPTKAINNADSHEYIAENTPSLICNP